MRGEAVSSCGGGEEILGYNHYEGGNGWLGGGGCGADVRLC